ncbi:hypothetical protein LCGC14_2635530, partial [marine sediment metagenome]
LSFLCLEYIIPSLFAPHFGALRDHYARSIGQKQANILDSF